MKIQVKPRYAISQNNLCGQFVCLDVNWASMTAAAAAIAFSLDKWMSCWDLRNFGFHIGLLLIQTRVERLQTIGTVRARLGARMEITALQKIPTLIEFKLT